MLVAALAWSLDDWPGTAAAATSAPTPGSATAARYLRTVATTVAKQTAARGHKQSSADVIVSVVGLVAIIVTVVVLGSLSARRHRRDAPADQRARRPSDPGRGLFG